MELKLIAGRAHPELAQAVASRLGRELTETTISNFADGETDVEICENVRLSHVVIIQPTPPPDSNWMELFILIDAAIRASAEKVTVVMPYTGYARQDRLGHKRKAITAALVLNLLVKAGANRIVTFDLHSGQGQGMVKLPFDNLYYSAGVIQALAPRDWSKVVLVSPDAGGLERCRSIAKKMECPIAVLDKRREKANESEVLNVVGNVKDADVIILDDMIDTAGTLVHGAEELLKHGAKRVSACCTHPVFSEKAFDNLSKSPFEEIVVANTIPVSEKMREALGPRLKIKNCAGYLGAAIQCIHTGESLSVLEVDALSDLAARSA